MGILVYRSPIMHHFVSLRLPVDLLLYIFYDPQDLGHCYLGIPIKLRDFISIIHFSGFI